MQKSSNSRCYYSIVLGKWYYLHHTSRLIVDHLVAKQIGTLVIGKNAQWKTEIDLGKQTHQNFVSIPHARLIEMLEYK